MSILTILVIIASGQFDSIQGLITLNVFRKSSSESDTTITCFRLVHLKKTLGPIYFKEEGITQLVNDGQYAKILCSRLVTAVEISHLSSAVQTSKAHLPIVVTEFGIIHSRSDVQLWKARLQSLLLL